MLTGRKKGSQAAVFSFADRSPSRESPGARHARTIIRAVEGCRVANAGLQSNRRDEIGLVRQQIRGEIRRGQDLPRHCVAEVIGEGERAGTKHVARVHVDGDRVALHRSSGHWIGAFRVHGKGQACLAIGRIDTDPARRGHASVVGSVGHVNDAHVRRGNRAVAHDGRAEIPDVRAQEVRSVEHRGQKRIDASVLQAIGTKGENFTGTCIWQTAGDHSCLRSDTCEACLACRFSVGVHHPCSWIDFVQVPDIPVGRIRIICEQVIRVIP